MKKTLLIMAVLCCMMSVTAQQVKKGISTNYKHLIPQLSQVDQINRQTAEFTHKLDSVTVSPFGANQVYTYDDQFRVVKLNTVVSILFYVTSREFTYDQYDNVIRVITIDPYETTKTVYSYTDDGERIIDEIEYLLVDDSWVEEEKIEYFSNDDDTYAEMIRYEYEEGEWIEQEKVEAYFTANGTLISQTYCYYQDEWVASEEVKYSYDGNDHCTMMLTYHVMGDGELEEREKEAYTYDARGNCTSIRIEEYDEEDGWVFFESTRLYYDLSTLCSNIAGFYTFTDEAMFNVNNKLLSMETIDDEGDTFTTNFYYSNCNGLVEITNSQIVLWPNPVAETLFIGAKDVQQVDIFTMDGKHVSTIENGFETINVRGLSQGCYLLKATMNDGSIATQKFVKQ